ncbi:hypothetical protein [Demequina phytophila]|nr:hypothetical protein [Demequina phytophila]
MLSDHGLHWAEAAADADRRADATTRASAVPDHARQGESPQERP